MGISRELKQVKDLFQKALFDEIPIPLSKTYIPKHNKSYKQIFSFISRKNCNENAS